MPVSKNRALVVLLAAAIVCVAVYAVVVGVDRPGKAHDKKHRKLPKGAYSKAVSDEVPVLFVMQGCHWCKKMLEECADMHFLVVDATADREAAAAVGASGFPHGVHKGKSATGASPDLKQLLAQGAEDLVEALMQKISK